MLMKPSQYDSHAVALPHSEHAQAKGAQVDLVTRFFQKLEAYSRIRRERADLMSLDDHLLRDIGLSRADAERIARKPFKWL